MPDIAQTLPLFPDQPATSGPVECLGLKFESDAARRAYFLNKLAERLTDPAFRQLEGFPLGTNEDILALSDPPYYTACPNPFLEEFVHQYARALSSEDSYHREPYLGTLQAGERHPVYAFHPYHTKVPPEVIRGLVEHYTEPGDLVLDGFCGSGMTGVAAREAGRHALLNDLSPMAAYISAVNCQSHDLSAAIRQLETVLAESEAAWAYLYETPEAGRTLSVNYYVWSDVFTCPECVHEFPFFPHGVIHHGNKVETRGKFPCPACGVELNVRRVERVLTHSGKKKQLVWVNAGQGRNRVNRAPNDHDLQLAHQVEEMEIRSWYPVDRIDPQGYSARLAQLGDKAISDVSRFLSRRNLIVFADLWARLGQTADVGLRNLCRAVLSSIFTVVSERQGYFGGGGGMSGNLYMPIVRMEKNIFDSLRRKIPKVAEAEVAKAQLKGKVLVTTQSTTHLEDIPEASVDYIYTDPPFGANIIYSEMNLLLEAWLRVKTNPGPEAVIDNSRHREYAEYAALMKAGFGEYFRILKPGRWITVEFHNTQASVWNLIQNAIGSSGFVIAQVDVLDKGSTTILADIRPGAAKYDLLISAYRPDQAIEDRFRLAEGTEAGAWDFVRAYLAQLPVFKETDNKAEVIIGRQSHLLFDRMVAFHVQRGIDVPLSAAEFHAGLERRFAQRDGMWFLPDQVSDYDRQRLATAEVAQIPILIKDEVTALQWLRNRLEHQPETYQELHPEFTRAISGWQKGERLLDLRELLEQNFLVYQSGAIPTQLQRYYSGGDEVSVWGRDRWYVPDPGQAGDLEKLRERALLKEFAAYHQVKGRRLAEFRLEAVRAGFKRAWQEHEYAAIIDVAQKLPEDILYEDPKLLMWYDQAVLRSQGDESQ